MRITRFWALFFSCAFLLAVAPAAFAQATVYTNTGAFEAASVSSTVTIPQSNSQASQYALGAALGTHSCANASVGIVFGTPTITITAPTPVPGSPWICIIDETWTPPLTNTNPKPTSDTIVVNGEDDYRIVFASPVYAVGLELLTNSTANETITLYYSDASSSVFADAVLDTAANSFEFVGFVSTKPITSLFVNTTGGASQNEGITGIRIATAQRVLIDIKPGSDPNSINLGSAGVIPVAILSSADFDATTIDPYTVDLAGASVKIVGNKNAKPLCHAEDVNGDSLLDLVCQVYTVDFLVEPGAASATLKATTYGGTPVEGADGIRIVPE